jgi:hypothetical protein
MKSGSREIAVGPGVSVLIETEAPKAKRGQKTRPSSIGSVPALSDVSKRVIDSVEDLGDELAKFCSGLLSKFDKIPRPTRPSEIEFTFGVKLSGEGNLKIVKLSGDTTLQVKAIWRDKPAA